MRMVHCAIDKEEFAECHKIYHTGASKSLMALIAALDTSHTRFTIKEEAGQSDFEILGLGERHENALADTRAFGENLRDCQNRYSDCRNTRKTIFPAHIKIHAVIGTVRAARNGDRRIPISVKFSWRTYAPFDRLFPFRARPAGGTRLEIIPLRNSRTIPSAKLIFQRHSRSFRRGEATISRRKSPFIPYRLNAS